MIGIDFDNTIVCYDGVFFALALQEGLIPSHIPTSKESVKSYLQSKDQEEEWIKLQGMVYGSKMELSKPYEGFFDFLSDAQENLVIISHKTKTPFRGPPYDLHEAARKWLIAKQISLPAFFELTKEAKIARIAEQKCTYFIDDLPDILLDPRFPKETKPILFDPNNNFPTNLPTMRSWHEIARFFQNTRAPSSC